MIGEDIVDYGYDQKKGRRDTCVADIMRSPNMSVYLDDPVEQARIMMDLHKLDCLPVIDFETQEFSGLITREDIENLPSNVIPYLKR
ncbi:MAG: CBS domain-containing protein [Alphaproteobacteria bacterium]